MSCEIHLDIESIWLYINNDSANLMSVKFIGFFDNKYRHAAS